MFYLLMRRSNMYLKELIKFFRIDLTNEDYLAIADTVRRELYEFKNASFFDNPLYFCDVSCFLCCS